MSENHQAGIQPGTQPVTQPGSQPGVTSMVGGILEDAQKLVRQEIALAQHEVAKAWDNAKIAAALLAGALVVFIVVGVLLGIMLAKLLYQLLPNHEWACFGIVGGVVAIVGGALIYYGIQRMSAVKVAFPQTAESLRPAPPPLLPRARGEAQAVSAGVSGN